MVALAGRGEPTRAAKRWLGRLHEEGLDVTLVSEEPIPDAGLPTQTVGHLRPLAVMRVIDLEMQIQAIHAVVSFGRRARLVSSLLPGSLRPSIEGLSSDLDPDTILDLLYGPLYMRLVLKHAPLDESFVDEVFGFISSTLSPCRETTP